MYRIKVVNRAIKIRVELLGVVYFHPIYFFRVASSPCLMTWKLCTHLHIFGLSLCFLSFLANILQIFLIYITFNFSQLFYLIIYALIQAFLAEAHGTQTAKPHMYTFAPTKPCMVQSFKMCQTSTLMYLQLLTCLQIFYPKKQMFPK